MIADGVALDTAGAASVASAQRRYEASARPRYGTSAPPPYRLRRPDELASFFDGLDLTEPGVVPCSQWRPDGRGLGGPGERDGAETAAAYCGVARKP